MSRFRCRPGGGMSRFMCRPKGGMSRFRWRWSRASVRVHGHRWRAVPAATPLQGWVPPWSGVVRRGRAKLVSEDQQMPAQDVMVGTGGRMSWQDVVAVCGGRMWW